MKTVAIAIIAKTPEAGKSKTRLSPPLRPEQCAEISACFIEDLASNIATLAVASHGSIAGYSLYTPAGTEDKLGRLLPDDFRLVLQTDGDLGQRLSQGITDIVAEGHEAAIIVSSDSPTLPGPYFQMAAEALLREDCVVLCPAFDGGYTFIGLRKSYARLFEDMPWSTEVVYEMTIRRAAEIGLKVVTTPMWYDVDDAATLALLRADLAGRPLPFEATAASMPAPLTSAYLGQLGNVALSAATPVGAFAS